MLQNYGIDAHRRLSRLLTIPSTYYDVMKHSTSHIDFLHKKGPMAAHVRQSSITQGLDFAHVEIDQLG